MPTAARVSADLYAVLGVDASASGDEIARAFRARAKQLHPDTSDDPDAAGPVQRARRRLRRAREPPHPPRVRPGAHGVRARDRAHRVRRSRRDRRARRRRRPSGGRAGGRGPRSSAARWWRCSASAPRSSPGSCTQTDARRHARVPPGRRRPRRRQRRHHVRRRRTGASCAPREPEQHGEGNGLGPTVERPLRPRGPDARDRRLRARSGRDITFAIVVAEAADRRPGVRGARRAPAAERAATAAR